MPVGATHVQKEVPLTAELNTTLQALTHKTAAEVTVEEWKVLGNNCFSNGSYLTAIRCYTKAIEKEGGDTAVLRSNRSAAYVKSSMHAGPALALKDAEKAVELAPMWHKAHLRVADAQLARHKLDEAKAAYERVLELEPGCATATAALQQLRCDLFLRELAQKERQQQLYGETEETHSEQGRSATPSATQRSGGARTVPEFHNAPWDSSFDEDPTGRRRPPTEAETEQLIRTWQRDTCLREDRTAMTPRAVSVQEADRQGGQAYKERLLRTFRQKVEQDEAFSTTLRENLMREQLVGADVDFRQGDKYRTQYARATNGIGLGITAEAFKDHIAYDKP